MADPKAPQEGYLNGRHGKVYVRNGEAYLLDTKTGRQNTVPQAEIEKSMASGRFVAVGHEEVRKRDRELKIAEEQNTAGAGVRAFAEAGARSLVDTATLPARLATAAVGGDQSKIPEGGDVVSSLLGSDPEKQRSRTEVQEVLSTFGGVAPDIFGMVVTGGGAPLARAAGTGLAKKAASIVARDGALGAVASGAMASEDAWRNNTTVDSGALVKSMGIGAILGGGLGVAGEFAGKGVRVATDAATGPGARDFLKNTVGVLRSAADVSNMVPRVPGITGGGRGGMLRTAAGALEFATKNIDGSSFERTAKGEIGDLVSAQRAQFRPIDDAVGSLSKESKAFASELSAAQKLEFRAADDLARYEAKIGSKIERATAKLDADVSSIQRGAEREARVAASEFKKASSVLEKQRVAMERTAIDAAPAITRAEAAVEKAKSYERLLSEDLSAAAKASKVSKVEGGVRRGRAAPDSPEIRAANQKLASARADVRAKEVELVGTQERLALKERAHRTSMRAAQESVEESQRKLSKANKAQSSDVANRKASFEREQRVTRESSDVSRREIQARATEANRSARTADAALQDRQKALRDAVMDREVMSAEHAGQLAEFSERRMGEAGAARDSEWRSGFTRNVIMGAGRGAERYARSAFRPAALMAAYSETGAHSPWQDLSEAQEDQREILADVVLKASGKLPGSWQPVSGVGDYESYPQGQFIYPGETREQAFRNRQQEAAQLLADPAALTMKISQGAEAVAAVSPEASQQVVNTAFRAAEWLSKFQAGTKQVSDPFRPQDTQVPVSPGEITTYERVWNATMFPGVILDKLATWQLDDETLMTAVQVHPEVVADIKQQVGEAVTLGEMKPTYQQRLQLGALFGLQAPEASPEMQGRIMMYAQSQMATEQSSSAAPPGRPAGSPTMSQQYKTVSQSAANPGQ